MVVRTSNVPVSIGPSAKMGLTFGGTETDLSEFAHLLRAENFMIYIPTIKHNRVLVEFWLESQNCT